MNHLSWVLVWFTIIAVFLLLILGGCGSCGGDDDDDNNDSSGDDDDTGGDDDDDNDDDNNDDDDYTPPPVVNMIPPVDYDGDGDAELLLQGISTDVTGTTETFYLAEPGTYERTVILSFAYSSDKGLASSWAKVVDFDLNNVWDLVISVSGEGVKGAKDTAPGIRVYMNGEFEDPAFTQDSPAGASCFARIFDVDVDGEPELGMECIHTTPSDYRQISFFDPGEDWSQGAIIGGQTYGELIVEGTIKPNDQFESAGNFSGVTKGPELLGVRYYEDSGRKYVKMIIFDAATGDETDQSTPIDLGTAYYTNHVTGDFDNDGIVEILIGKNFEDTAKLTRYAQAIIYKGNTFTVEYETAQVNDHTIFTHARHDINNDGVLDPTWLFRSQLDNKTAYLSLDGTDGYSEMIAGHYSPVATIDPGLVPFEGRGDIDIGYDFAGATGPDVVIQERDLSLPTTYGLFHLLNLDTGTLDPTSSSFDLGDLGSLYSRIQDLGGDGVLDMVTMATKRISVDKAYDYHQTLMIMTGPSFDVIFTKDLGTNNYYDSYVQYDLTGDQKADLLLRRHDGTFYEYTVYDCVGGCTESATISSDPDQMLYFVGPFL